MHYRIKIEIWASNGLNLGISVHEMNFDDIEGAIDEARKMYVKFLPKEKSKELKIFTEDGLVWRFHKGKVETYKPATLSDKSAPVGDVNIQAKEEHS